MCSITFRTQYRQENTHTAAAYMHIHICISQPPGNTHTHASLLAYSGKVCCERTHTQNYAQTTVWHVCKNVVAQWSGQENKTKALWGSTLLSTNLRIIHFILIDNQSSGSLQTGYPIRHLRTISLPPTHKVCLFHPCKIHKLSHPVCLPLALSHTQKIKQIPPLNLLCLTQRWELIERLLSRQILLRILRSVLRGRLSR